MRPFDTRAQTMRWCSILQHPVSGAVQDATSPIDMRAEVFDWWDLRFAARQHLRRVWDDDGTVDRTASAKLPLLGTFLMVATMILGYPPRAGMNSITSDLTISVLAGVRVSIRSRLGGGRTVHCGNRGRNHA